MHNVCKSGIPPYVSLWVEICKFCQLAGCHLTTSRSVMWEWPNWNVSIIYSMAAKNLTVTNMANSWTDGTRLVINTAISNMLPFVNTELRSQVGSFIVTAVKETAALAAAAAFLWPRCFRWPGIQHITAIFLFLLRYPLSMTIFCARSNSCVSEHCSLTAKWQHYVTQYADI